MLNLHTFLDFEPILDLPVYPTKPHETIHTNMDMSCTGVKLHDMMIPSFPEMGVPLNQPFKKDFLLSADPGLSHGRGGTWDHLWCGLHLLPNDRLWQAKAFFF